MSSYYTNTLYPLQDKVLNLIAGLNTAFYLTGGTALSRFYYNVRYSDDLDFFANQDGNFLKSYEEILKVLSSNLNIEIISKSDSFITIIVEKTLKVDFVNDVLSRFGENKSFPLFPKVDNVKNILSNKLSALISRDEAKDVVDIWSIANNEEINWKEIFISANSKAVGIFPPLVAERLIEFPIELLDKIKWVDGKKPEFDKFKTEIKIICDSILKVK